MSGHSAIGPSSADRWVNCPGSVALAATCPAPKTSEAAAEGSVAHKLAEKFLTGEMDDLALMTKVGETVTQDGHDVEITDEMIEGARLYKETIDADYFALIEQDKPAAIERHCERRVSLKSLHPDLWGTADYLLFQKGNRLIVYDYKFGKGKMVSPRENPQAALYALGAMETIAGAAFDVIELVIVQPRALGERVKRWEADKAWLEEQFKPAVAAALEESRKPGARLKAGDHCRWCPAQAVCPELARQAQETAQADFAALAPTESDIAAGDLRGLPPVPAMPVEKLAQALDWEDAIESWYGAIRQRVQEILAAGGDVPGYKLVDGRSNRQWADGTGEAAAAHLAPKYGHRVYAPKKPLSVAQMEKLVGKGKLPEELVVKPEAAKKVAKSDDPRPVASTSAQQDFDPLQTPRIEYTPDAIDDDPLAVPAVMGPAPHDGTGAPVEDDLLAQATGKKREPLWPQ